MASFTWATLQFVLLGLVVSSLAQFQQQSFDDFGSFQQPQQQFQQPQAQPQRFATVPQFPSQPQRLTAKIRRPQQSRKFVDPQSVTVTPGSSQGFQSPQTRFGANQQFVQPAAVPRAPVRQQFDSEFTQGVQTAQDAYQQQPPQVQSFEPPPPPPPPARVRTQSREPLEPVVVAPARASRPGVTADTENEAVARHQAETAKYSFQASVTDTLSDNQNVREEVRDGLALKGVYSYSDGYFKRTVHYEADENGYRVVKEDVEPIGDGPQEDPNGSAEIRSNIGGNQLGYTITAADINPRVRQPQQLQQQQQQQQRFLPSQ